MHMSTINPIWLTSTVTDLARSIHDGRHFDRMPILADALMDAGCDDDEMIIQCRTGTTLPASLAAILDAEHDARMEAIRLAIEARRSWVWDKAGLIGNRWSIRDLAAHITRRRPRGSGSKTYLGKRLGEALQRRADRRWAASVKGQRGPTPKQALHLAASIREAVENSQKRCSARTVDCMSLIKAARNAAASGSYSDDGGKVSCSSYGYSWSTTRISAQRIRNGLVEVIVSRTTNETVFATARHWQDITLDTTVLSGGGVVGIRRKHGWDCYDDFGHLVSVAVRIDDAKLVSRWSKWEHGKTVAEAKAEIAHKVGILAVEGQFKEFTEETATLRDQEMWMAEGIANQERIAAAKHQAKVERASRLLARIGANTTVSYDDARACGACNAGIQAFAQRLGLPLDAKPSLAQIAAVEPTWAVKLARRIVEAKIAVA